jgi:putative ABC transport system ATP-binding protein
MSDAAPRLRTAGLRSALAGPFDVALAPGSCLAVTGPSGAGKSLFLRMIADLDDHEGEAWLDGAPRSGFAAPDWRRRVAYMAAEPGWWTEPVGAHFATAPGTLLARLGLPADSLGRTVALCSTGERQRLALARTLVQRPAVLLLDEPTGALDAESITLAEAVLREAMQAGAAIILVTHNPAQAERLGTQHARIEGGRMI